MCIAKSRLLLLLQPATLAALVLSIALIGPPAWAKPPGGHLDIHSVFVTFNDANYGGVDTLTITGMDFDFGPGPLVITLGDFPDPLMILGTPSATEIVVKCPAIGDICPDGDFLLTVSTGNGQSQNDEYDLTISGGNGSPGSVGNLTCQSVVVARVLPSDPEIPSIAFSASCPAGTIATGGGHFADSGVLVRTSEPGDNSCGPFHPDPCPATTPTLWRCVFENQTIAPRDVACSAVCCSITAQ